MAPERTALSCTSTIKIAKDEWRLVNNFPRHQNSFVLTLHLVQSLHARLQNAIKQRGTTVTAARELEDDLSQHSPQDLAEWKDQERRWLAHVATHGTLPENIVMPYRMTEDDGKSPSLYQSPTDWFKLQQHRKLMTSSKRCRPLLKSMHLLAQARALLACFVQALTSNQTSQSCMKCYLMNTDVLKDVTSTPDTLPSPT